MTDVSRGTGGDFGDDLRQELVKTLVPLLINIGVLVALMKRDDIARLGMRLQYMLTNRRQIEMQDVAVARFRQEMAVWEHEEMGR